MSTRYAKEGSPLCQNRYLSSREFSGLRGINAVAVAPRVALLRDEAQRRLIWFIQMKSLEPGGLKALVDYVTMSLEHDRVQAKRAGKWDSTAPRPLEEFLIDLCINPRILLNPPDTQNGKLEAWLTKDRFPEVVKECDFGEHDPRFVGSVLSALSEFKRAEEKAALESFVLTENCTSTWTAAE